MPAVSTMVRVGTCVIAGCVVFDGEPHKGAVHVTIELMRETGLPEWVEAPDERAVGRAARGALQNSTVKHGDVAVMEIILGEHMAIANLHPRIFFVGVVGIAVG